jgi:urease accessory protein
MDISTRDLLTLMQWLSPAFPVGGFAYSHGLEWAIESAQVNDEASLHTWIFGALNHGAGTTDARFLAAAYHASPEDWSALDAQVHAFAACAERLKESDLQGAAFGQVVRDVWDLPVTGLSYPVAVGAAAQARGLPLVPVSAAFLQGFAANLVAVGQRLIPIGQTAGQRLIQALAPDCAAIAQDTQDGALDQLSSCAFLTDIAAMRHETQYSRTFRT